MTAMVRVAVPDDAALVKDILRDFDKGVIEKFGDLETLLRLSIEQATECYIGLWNDEPVCIVFIKVKSVISGKAQVGLLLTTYADKHPKVLARYAVWFMEYMKDRYYEISGNVDPIYTLPRRWLKWLGFEVNGTAFVWRRD